MQYIINIYMYNIIAFNLKAIGSATSAMPVDHDAAKSFGSAYLFFGSLAIGSNCTKALRGKEQCMLNSE